MRNSPNCSRVAFFATYRDRLGPESADVSSDSARATATRVGWGSGGTATVAQVHEGRWISFAGPATINRDADAVAHAVARYAVRYRQPRVNPIRVVIEIAIDKVMSSADLVVAADRSAA